MGAALALKPLLGRRFSVLSFGLAQVAIDLEPGIRMLLGTRELHGWTHTYLGATVIAAMLTVLVAPPCRWILRRWNAELRFHKVEWLVTPEVFASGAIATGAFIGTWSHVLLDSLVHFDIRPYAPLYGANPHLGAMTFPAMHAACVIAGVIGIAAWMLQAYRAREN
jgi:hypothetical protein